MEILHGYDENEKEEDTADSTTETLEMWKEKFHEAARKLQEAEELQQQRNANSTAMSSPSRAMTQVSTAGGNCAV